MSLKYRSFETELLEADTTTEAEAADAYRELCTLHGWLGNTAAVLRRLRRPAAGCMTLACTVLDIGCGQGALLEVIRQRLGMQVVGFDLRPAPSNLPVRIVAGNAATDPLPDADVAVAMMLAHHLTETDLIAMIRNVSRSCDRMILLDLVRHPVPLALFRAFVQPLLCPINASDGETSIRRGFTSAEMRQIVAKALAGF